MDIAQLLAAAFTIYYPFSIFHTDKYGNPKGFIVFFEARNIDEALADAQLFYGPNVTATRYLPTCTGCPTPGIPCGKQSKDWQCVNPGSDGNPPWP